MNGTKLSEQIKVWFCYFLSLLSLFKRYEGSAGSGESERRGSYADIQGLSGICRLGLGLSDLISGESQVGRAVNLLISARYSRLVSRNVVVVLESKFESGVRLKVKVCYRDSKLGDVAVVGSGSDDLYLGVFICLFKSQAETETADVNISSVVLVAVSTSEIELEVVAG